MTLIPILAQWQQEQIRHQVAIAGILSDKHTQQPIPGAEIRIIQAPQSFRDRLKLKALQFDNQWQTKPGSGDRLWMAPGGSFAVVNLANGQYTVQTWTAVDGSFKFLDLPDGEYSLQASLPTAGTRYGTATSATPKEKTLIVNLKDKITPALLELQLPPTVIEGKVTKPGATGEFEPVPMAKVQILETGDYTYTNDAGDYLLTRLEASETKEWAIAVSAPGYDLNTSETVNKVKLLQGQTQTHHLRLKRKVMPSTSKPQ
jgi:hypothetical protein